MTRPPRRWVGVAIDCPDVGPVARFYDPAEFAILKEEGLKMGFAHVESGPLVRSSYHAGQQIIG